jgi:soluble lytic murein transglycosylase-like protein
MIVRARGMGQAPLTAIQQQIVTAAQTLGIDPALALAVAQVESSFNPNAVSSAGATGLFQLMPATAASVGVTDSTDPSQNIQGGLSYLSQLLAQYGGDVSTALWAYNAGPGNVAKGNLPSETANYIPAVETAQSSWSASLGTSTPPSSSTTVDLSTYLDQFTSPSSDDSDNTLLYLGLALAAGALFLSVAS